MIKILITIGVVCILVAVFALQKQDTKETASNAPSKTDIRTNENQEQSDTSSTTNTTWANEPVIASNAVLDLSGKKLNKTPEYVFSSTHIQKLDLSTNNLDGSLQAEVRLLENLKVLDLSNNQFTGVPAEIGQLKNLEILNLSNNKITGLPHEIGNLSRLKLLDLRGNDYSSSDLDIIKKNLPPTTEIAVD